MNKHHVSRLPAAFACTVAILMLCSCAAPDERAANFLANARAYFAKDELTLASVEVRNALDIDPALVDAHYLQAELFERTHNWVAYRDSLRRVVDLDPRHFDAQLGLGTMAALNGSLPEADAAARAALDVRPDDPSANALMGAVRLRQRNTAEAQTFASHALAADSTNAEAIALQTSIDLETLALDHAAGLLTVGIAAHPDNPLLRIQQIRVEEARGNPDGVVAAFRGLISERPQTLEYYEALASYYGRTGQRGTAEAVLRDAIGNVEDTTAAKLALASFLADDDPRRAAAQLAQFITAEDDNATPLKFGLARLYVQQGQIDGAQKLYRAIVEAQGGDSTAARNQLARIEIERRRLEEASRYIEETLLEDPRNTIALTLRASVQLSRRQTDDAIATLREVLRDTPNSMRALNLLADAYLSQGEVELAQSTLVRALEANPRDTAATHTLAGMLMRHEHYADAAALLTQALQLEPNPTTAQMLVRTKIALHQWDDAKAVVARVAPTDAARAAVTYIDGLALQATGDYRGSTMVFEKLLSYAPSSAVAIKGIARNFRLMDADDEGGTYFGKLITARPDIRQAYLALAEHHAANKRWHDAETVLKTAIDRHSDWLPAYRALAATQIAQSNLDGALATQRRIVDRQPNDVESRLYVAGILEKQRNYDGAVKFYRQVLALDPANDVAANNLAALLIRNATHDSARIAEAYGLARRFEGTLVPEFADTLGWIHVLRGNFRRGIELLERASTGAPRSPEIEYHLGAAYLKSLDAARAKSHLEKSLALAVNGEAHPSSAEAKELLQGL